MESLDFTYELLTKSTCEHILLFSPTLYLSRLFLKEIKSRLTQDEIQFHHLNNNEIKLNNHRCDIRIVKASESLRGVNVINKTVLITLHSQNIRLNIIKLIVLPLLCADVTWYMDTSDCHNYDPYSFLAMFKDFTGVEKQKEILEYYKPVGEL